MGASIAIRDCSDLVLEYSRDSLEVLKVFIQLIEHVLHTALKKVCVNQCALCIAKDFI